MRSPNRCIAGLPWLLLLASTAPSLALPSVAATATAGATSLILDGEGSSSTHIVKAADLAMSTDGAAGFTLSITSGNLAKTGATPIPFQVALVDDGAAPPSSSAFTVPSGSTYTLVTAAAGSASRDLYLKYTPAAIQDPGQYSASIDLSIIDN